MRRWTKEVIGLTRRNKAVAFAAALTFCAITFFAAHLLGPGSGKVGGAVEKAEKLMTAGDYRSAANALRAAYREKPTPELKIALARALLASGAFDSAIEVLHSGVDAPEAEWASRHLEAEALVRSGRYREAVKTGADLHAQFNGDGRASLILARADYGLGLYDEAGSHLADALRSGGQVLGEAWLFRARLALDGNETSVARSALQRARDAGANRAALSVLDIEAMVRDGDLEAARQQFAVLPRTKSTSQRLNADYEYAAAFIEAASGSYESAARRVRAVGGALGTEPNRALFAVLVKASAGDAAQAEAELRTLLRSSPQNWVLLDATAAFLLRRGRAEEAAPIIDRLEAVAPAAALARRLALLQENRNYDGMLLAAKKTARETDATSILMSSSRIFGCHARASGNENKTAVYAEAFLAATHALAMADLEAMAISARRLDAFEEDPAALALAGEIYTALGDDAGAQERFDRALMKSPAFAAALTGRVRIDVRRGDVSRSVAMLKGIVRAAPDYLPARVLLGRLKHYRGEFSAAKAVLAPAASDLARDQQDAIFYAHVLKDAGAQRTLKSHASNVRRYDPAGPLTASVLALAGEFDAAATVSRAALMNRPDDQSRLRQYQSLMSALGRDGEAAAFLREAGLTVEAAQSVPEEDAPSLAETRQAYFVNPDDPETPYRFGIALADRNRNYSARLRSEACFWGKDAACAGQFRSDS